MPRVTRKTSQILQGSNEPTVKEGQNTEETNNCLSRTSSVPASSTAVHNQWIMIGPSAETSNRSPPRSLEFVKLRNPRTSRECIYGFSPGNLDVYELQKFSHGKRSWFIGDSVQADGSYYISTPINPLFLVLPYLYKTDRASPLDQLLVDDDFPETSRLLKCTGIDKLQRIADLKQTPSIKAWKYNEEKTLNWLTKLHAKLSKALESKNISASSVAQSAFYVAAEKASKDDYDRYAFGMICEYLGSGLVSKLNQHLRLPEKTNETLNSEPSAKRAKISSDVCEPLEDYSKAFTKGIDETKEKAGTAKTRALANAAKGSKNIASFFSKR